MRAFCMTHLSWCASETVNSIVSRLCEPNYLFTRAITMAMLERCSPGICLLGILAVRARIHTSLFPGHGRKCEGGWTIRAQRRTVCLARRGVSSTTLLVAQARFKPNSCILVCLDTIVHLSCMVLLACTQSLVLSLCLSLSRNVVRGVDAWM